MVELARDGHLKEWANAVADAGLSPSIHAIGDEAVRVVLDAVAGIDAKRRPRTEHAQQIDPEDIPRFQGVIASMQPLHKADDARYVTRRLGKNRLKGFFAFHELLEAGAILAFGSDWPVVPTPNPWPGIESMVTRSDPAGTSGPGFSDTLVPYSIPDAGQGKARACFTIDNPGMINQVDVGLGITHGWVGDLIVTLTHEDTGTSVVLIDRPG